MAKKAADVKEMAKGLQKGINKKLEEAKAKEKANIERRLSFQEHKKAEKEELEKRLQEEQEELEKKEKEERKRVLEEKEIEEKERIKEIEERERIKLVKELEDREKVKEIEEMQRIKEMEERELLRENNLHKEEKPAETRSVKFVQMAQIDQKSPSSIKKSYKEPAPVLSDDLNMDPGEENENEVSSMSVKSEESDPNSPLISNKNELSPSNFDKENVESNKSRGILHLGIQPYKFQNTQPIPVLPNEDDYSDDEYVEPKGEFRLTERQLADYKEAFAMFDLDGSGGISTEELGNVMMTLGNNPTQKELEAMIEQVDTNHDGICDFDEFLVLMNNRMGDYENEDEVRDILAVFDKTGDGKIPVESIKEYLTMFGDKMSLEDVEQLISEADKDNDGFILYEDFVEIIMND